MVAVEVDVVAVGALEVVEVVAFGVVVVAVGDGATVVDVLLVVGVVVEVAVLVAVVVPAPGSAAYDVVFENVRSTQ